MHPCIHASNTPDKAAFIMGHTGEVVTYGELDARSNQCAQLLRSRGHGVGASVAILMPNNVHYFEICWAAQRSGLYYTPLSTHLTADEIEYIARDCGAEILIASHELRDVAEELVERLPGVRTRLMVGGVAPSFESYEEVVGAESSARISDEREGQDMLYSSGTTGYPKGVRLPLPDREVGEPDYVALGMMHGFWKVRPEDVYLSPAPLYHGAPMRCSMAMLRIGATVVVMERFDAEQALALIERHRVTLSQWVPTMFVRMLKLPESARSRHDLSSQRLAVHAAAPCPIPIKQEMIEWWGPIIYEYYSATEAIGATEIDSEEWLAHPGSVGRPTVGTPHIVDDEGHELAVGEIGSVYFDGGHQFAYHNDAEKTAKSYDERGWATVGDMGYLDEDGYLYLTDRKTNMIISGGVNIYPQETENVLITHPKVADVAVFGVPSEDFGEEVKAVVELAKGEKSSADLEQALMAFCREHLSKLKCPRSIDFEAKLPRAENGKLYKRRLRERYWEGHETRIL
jgi:acyl-CoA synthetase (AMP-forming)/AMP-acid ligase II